jgi:hypothetical protein
VHEEQRVQESKLDDRVVGCATRRRALQAGDAHADRRATDHLNNKDRKKSKEKKKCKNANGRS